MISKLNQKNIFLFDGVGAAISFVFTGLLLPSFSMLLGLNPEVLYGLATLAFIFMLYSLSIYFLVKKCKKWMLFTIIFANSLYCIVSGALLIFYKELTSLGLTFLLFEMAVLIIVIAIELQVYKRFDLN